MRFADPLLLALALGLIPMWLFYRRRPAAVRFPSSGILARVQRSRYAALRHLPFALRCAAVLGLTIALARPQSGNAHNDRTTEGLDIVLVLDTSGSMEARDYVMNGERPTRLTVVKRVIADFIKERPSDRIGMVVFGTEAFTQAPLTLDHEVLLRFLDHVQIAMAGPATAMGDGMATAVNRLKTVNAKSKVVILLTDGGNNAGRVDPLAAAQAAKTLGVKVYTIGVGSNNTVPIVVDGKTQAQEVDLDEKALKDVAAATGGRYFPAGDTETLINVYKTIDLLEKTKVKIDTFAAYDERYGTFAGMAVLFVLGEMLVALSRFRRIP